MNHLVLLQQSFLLEKILHHTHKSMCEFFQPRASLVSLESINKMIVLMIETGDKSVIKDCRNQYSSRFRYI